MKKKKTSYVQNCQWQSVSSRIMYQACRLESENIIYYMCAWIFVLFPHYAYCLWDISFSWPPLSIQDGRRNSIFVQTVVVIVFVIEKRMKKQAKELCKLCTKKVVCWTKRRSVNKWRNELWLHFIYNHQKAMTHRVRWCACASVCVCASDDVCGFSRMCWSPPPRQK